MYELPIELTFEKVYLMYELPTELTFEKVYLMYELPIELTFEKVYLCADRPLCDRWGGQVQLNDGPRGSLCGL